ncbi:MAG: LysE family translocator [Candidatus Gracilibacteria bacterium]|nr:LysE family translocator [Candidatus Gracilibacteria bacterium]
MYTTLVITILSAYILGLVSPGPDFIMVVKNSLSFGRKSGIITAMGIGLGVGIHILYCLFGLAIIISKSILLFNVIKILGALYLIYIGYLTLKSKGTNIYIQENKKGKISNFSSFKMGFLTNVLNPKISLFFLGLFTFVIKPETPYYIIGLTGIILIIITGIWFSLVSVFLTTPKTQNIFNKFSFIFNKIFGGLIILLGTKIILSK